MPERLRFESEIEDLGLLETPDFDLSQDFLEWQKRGKRLHVDFYDRNTQLAKNRTVKRILDSLLLRTLRLRRLSLSQPDRMQASLDDNARLLKAYENRDARLAAALISSNHMNALAALEKCLPR